MQVYYSGVRDLQVAGSELQSSDRRYVSVCPPSQQMHSAMWSQLDWVMPEKYVTDILN